MINEQFGILQGIKVLNVSAVIAGPFACGLFSDHGADVIYVESTLSKDILRKVPTWAMEHRNQRAMALNIPTPEGKEIIKRLLADTDILLESSKGRTWEKWGLSDEELWKIKPDLVITHISGYGQSGVDEYVTRGSYDPAGQAFSGFMAINGMPGEGNPPMLARPYMCDYITGFTAAWSSLAALLRARKTGKGESVDVAQYESMLRIQAHYPLDGFNKGKEVVRLGNTDPLQATETIYKCKDGEWVYIGMTGAGVIKRGLPVFELENDPDFTPPPSFIMWSNKAQSSKYITKVRQFCAERTSEEVTSVLNEANVPCCAIMTYAKMLQNPQYIARESYTEWVDPAAGKIKGVGIVPKFKNNPGKVVSGSPAYGADNDAILSELGYTHEQISGFYERNIIAKD